MDASVQDRIAAARDALIRAGLPLSDAALDAAVLARHALGWDRATLLARGRETPPPSFDRCFDAFVARRAAREPVAMIMGSREFWGLEFEVTPDVLVPRPESELIVEEALAAFSEPPDRAIDVGTGSGCLAVVLCREFQSCHLIATDVSDKALAVARRNAVCLGVADRISFVRTSFLTGLSARVDLIVANPPYVAESDAGTLPAEVVEHEPHVALFSGEDGLSALREILATAPPLLAANGRLIVEFGFGQETMLTDLATRAGWRLSRVRKDLQGIPRTMVLRR